GRRTRSRRPAPGRARPGGLRLRGVLGRRVATVGRSCRRSPCRPTLRRRGLVGRGLRGRPTRRRPLGGRRGPRLRGCLRTCRGRSTATGRTLRRLGFSGRRLDPRLLGAGLVALRLLGPWLVPARTWLRTRPRQDLRAKHRLELRRDLAPRIAATGAWCRPVVAFGPVLPHRAIPARESGVARWLSPAHVRIPVDPAATATAAVALAIHRGCVGGAIATPARAARPRRGSAA